MSKRTWTEEELWALEFPLTPVRHPDACEPAVEGGDPWIIECKYRIDFLEVGLDNLWYLPLFDGAYAFYVRSTGVVHSPRWFMQQLLRHRKQAKTPVFDESQRRLANERRQH